MGRTEARLKNWIEQGKSLSGCNPTLAEEWDYEKNAPLLPTEVLRSSSKKVWWKDKEGHGWQATINSRDRGSGCPYCSGKKVLPGYNDLAKLFPDIASEFDTEKNSNIRPSDVLSGTAKKYWWKCKNGHTWEAAVVQRTKGGTGCPFCSGQKVWMGFNDLASQMPNVAEEWDYEKNEPHRPEEYTVKSTFKAWWRCEKGHSWQVSVANRASGTGCPVCANKVIVAGENDLATLYPEVAKEWDSEKNGSLSPNEVAISSGKKIWWRCAKGHSWRTTIASRTAGSKCPECTKEQHTSFPEKAILFYVRKMGYEVENNQRYDFLSGKEIDIFIPELKMGIEYDGGAFHTDSERDIQKNRLCEKSGIRLIRVRESECPNLPNDIYVITVLKNDKASLTDAIKSLSSLIGYPSLDVDVARDEVSILELQNRQYRDNSLFTAKPELLSEWDAEKNAGLDPYSFSIGSRHEVWWKCKNNHSWKQSISHRYSGKGCPYCAGQKVWKGFNDFATAYPELLEEWDYDKNELKPDEVTKTSGKKVFWKCKNGHSWEAAINNRVKNHGCPYCYRLQRKKK